MGETFCGRCGTKLDDEPSDTPTDQRQPCPNCGSLARRFDIVLGGAITATGSVTISPPTISAKATVFPPTIITGDAVDHAIETLRPIAFRVEFLEPTDAAGSWTAQAFDEADELVGMSEAQTWDEALLAIADQIDPKRFRRDDGS